MNLLDRVLLSPAVVAAWRQVCLQALSKHKIQPASCPDEQARELPDGWLEIYVELPPPVGRLSLACPPGSWAWEQTQ